MLDKEMDEYVTRVEDQAYEAGVSVGKSQERQRLMDEWDDWDKFVADHWALPLVDTPDALVAVIETKISRAVLHERRKIIERLSALAYFDQDGHEMISEFKNDLIALVKGGSE